MKLFTIGFTQKRAEVFFEQLKQNSIQRLIDIRLNPKGQLTGFTKQDDLPYFINHLVPECQYIHMPGLAPTKEILNDYRNDWDWPRYTSRFEQLMDERNIPASLDRDEFVHFQVCLLCSETKPDKCHRRLVAERIAKHWPDIEIVHL